MNFEREEMCVDEVEFDIKNIIVQCVRKIRVAIIFALIFAIALPSLIYAVDLKAYNSQNTGEIVELTEEEALGVEDYLLLKEKISFLKEYQENSMLFEMDCNNVYQGKVQFYVNSNGEEKYDIANAITNYINNKAFSEQMSSELSYVQEKYAYELVYAENTEKDTAIINVKVYAVDAVKCKEMVGVAKKVVEAYSEELQTIMKEHELVIVEESYVCGYVDDVYKTQSNQVYNMATLLSKIRDYENAFSLGQKAAVSEATGEANSADLTNREKPKFSFVFLIVGGIIGFILGMGVVVVLTIFNGKIQSEKELSKRLNINCLGSLRIGKIGKIDKLIDKHLYKVEITDRDIETLCARVQLCLKDSTSKRVELIGTQDIFSDNLIKKLQKEMGAKGIKCEVLGNVIKDAVALQRISKTENVLIIEQIGKSRVKDIYEEAKICVEADASVVGYILVRA